MKSIYTLLASAALLAAMPSAFAGSTVDMTVTGSIIPGSCTPTLSAAQIDFGKISAADLNLNSPTSFPSRKRQSTLNVLCDAPTLYGIRGIDNRAATVGDTSSLTPYGMGKTPADENLGAHYLEVQPSRSTIDGKPAFVSVGDASGTTWTAAAVNGVGIRNYGELLGFTDTVGVTTGPIPVEVAVYGLEHSLVVAPANGLTLTDEVQLDGNATIEVVYL